jgi:MFS family permease
VVDQVPGRNALLAVLATLVVVVVATNTTAALAQPQISETFGVGPADTGWVVFGYSATFAVATALYGAIAARFGVTRSLVSGVVLLAAGSGAAVVAPSMELLIASRMVQGAGYWFLLLGLGLARPEDGIEFWLPMSFMVVGALLFLWELSMPGFFVAVPATVLVFLGLLGLIVPGFFTEGILLPLVVSVVGTAAIHSRQNIGSLSGAMAVRMGVRTWLALLSGPGRPAMAA